MRSLSPASAKKKKEKRTGAGLGVRFFFIIEFLIKPHAKICLNGKLVATAAAKDMTLKCI